MASDHHHRFQIELIGWEMGGDPTSFHTRSLEIGVAMVSMPENGWESRMETLHVQRWIVFDGLSKLCDEKIQKGCLNEK